MTGKFLLVRPGEGPAYAVAGGMYTFKATAEQTGGTYAAFEILVPPGGGAPPHAHTREEEAFYVLSGEVTFELEGSPVRAPAGTFVHLSREVPHAFTNQSSEAARLLCWTVPAGIEQFFAGVGQVLAGGTETAPVLTSEEIQNVAASAPRYGIRILAPPAE